MIIHWHSQDTEQFRPQKDPACCAFMTTPASLPCSPSLIHKLWQPLICSKIFFLKYFRFKMLCKWNHAVCNLLGLAFFTQHNSLDIHPSSCVSIVCSFVLLSSIPWCVYTITCLTIHLLKDSWLVPSYWVLGEHKSSFL